MVKEKEMTAMLRALTIDAYKNSFVQRRNVQSQAFLMDCAIEEGLVAHSFLILSSSKTMSSN